MGKEWGFEGVFCSLFSHSINQQALEARPSLGTRAGHNPAGETIRVRSEAWLLAIFLSVLFTGFDDNSKDEHNRNGAGGELPLEAAWSCRPLREPTGTHFLRRVVSVQTPSSRILPDQL